MEESSSGIACMRACMLDAWSFGTLMDIMNFAMRECCRYLAQKKETEKEKEKEKEKKKKNNRKGKEKRGKEKQVLP